MNDALTLYLQSIKQFPLLAEEEEQRLLREAAEGSQKARKRLIESNLRLVVSIARDYKNDHLSFLDLIQEGNIGLMNAVDKFDFSKNVRFSTCAYWYIKQSILRALENKSKTIRTPSYLIELKNKIKKFQDSYFSSHGTEISIKGLAEHFQLSENEILRILESSNDVGSLDILIGKTDDSTIGDLISDDKNSTPEQVMDDEGKREILESILNTLTERERDVLKYRYGLIDGIPKTLEEIGNIFNLSKERIRQIESKALQKLRNPARADILRRTYN